MPMNYVPRLKEEEALILILRALAVERKGQGTVRELKLSIGENKLRPWSAEDSAGNPERSGAPMWHQIIQNASDRLEDDRHFYRSKFVRVISSSPHKVLQISDEGRQFATEIALFEAQLIERGFQLFDYLDVSPLDGDSWRRVEGTLKSYKIRYETGNEKQDLLRSLRSREYSFRHHPDYERIGLHTKMIDELSKIADKAQKSSLGAWKIGRDLVGGLANLESRRENLLAQFQESQAKQSPHSVDTGS